MSEGAKSWSIPKGGRWSEGNRRVHWTFKRWAPYRAATSLGKGIIMQRLRALALVAAPLALAAAAAPVALSAQAAQSGLAQVQAHLRAVQTMTANFSQSDRQGHNLNGTLIIRRPGRVRFDYGRSANMLIVGDGNALTFIDYDVG